MIILLSLSATASFAQKAHADSSIKLKISEYRIFEECCFRENQLEKDTLMLRSGIREYRNEISAINSEIVLDEKMLLNQSKQVALLTKSNDDAQKELEHQKKRKLFYRKAAFVLPAISFVAGVILTAFVLK